MLGMLPDDGSAGVLTLPARDELWVTMQPAAPGPSRPERPVYRARWRSLRAIASHPRAPIRSRARQRKP